MGTLPQLIEEDIALLDGALRELLVKSEASTALIADKGGFLITSKGNDLDFDLTSIAALASGAFMASQVIATLAQETGFNSTYQQGENFSLFVINVDENCLLVVIFKSQTGIGVVKFYSADAVQGLAKQIAVAAARAPGHGFDLSELNLANPQELFRKK